MEFFPFQFPFSLFRLFRLQSTSNDFPRCISYSAHPSPIPYRKHIFYWFLIFSAHNLSSFLWHFRSFSSSNARVHWKFGRKIHRRITFDAPIIIRDLQKIHETKTWWIFPCLCKWENPWHMKRHAETLPEISFEISGKQAKYYSGIWKWTANERSFDSSETRTDSRKWKIR